MATPVEMPKLGNTVEDCLLARWNKSAGEAVAEGELVAEIETDKATFELTAPVSGTLLATFFQPGDLVPVFTNICVIGAPGENVEAFQPRAHTETAPGAQTVTPPAPVPAAIAAATPAEQASPYSPRARRFAAEHNFHPDRVAGSGPRGRVLEQDLRRHRFESPRPTPLAQSLLDAGCELPSGAAGTVRASDLGPAPEKLSFLRDRVARRLRESLTTTAQFTLNTSADATGLLALRARIKARGPSSGFPDVNINELVMFCAVKALALAPEVNVGFVDGKLYRHQDVNIGFACDTPRGLLVPVVRKAQSLSLGELAVRIKSLTQQAIEGGISVEDLDGGTFTVSNLGVYGIESFSPILNTPQVAILGVNAISLKPVRRDGGVVFVDSIGLSLTCDHQIIDGAPGARFLKICRQQIESVEAIAQLEF